MIVKVSRSGKSFRGLVIYITHDPDGAQTAHRVAWTHTLNLANDDVMAAADEMNRTFLNAAALKRSAGIRAGGRPVVKPVRHISFSWHPSEQPSQEHMIEAVKDCLRHLGCQDHQAVLAGHIDKEHRHVHVALNSIHPETGRSMSDAYSWRRVQNWALQYERDRGMIFCEQRLQERDQREPSPTRGAWLGQKQVEAEYNKLEALHVIRAPDYFERGDDTVRNAKEWQFLKAIQRREREAFFIGGKQAYRDACKAAYRAVRNEFRTEWSSYYQRQREGMDANRLAEIKADILNRQNGELEARRAAACARLRTVRDVEREEILERQKQERRQLRDQQEKGISSPDLLARINSERNASRENLNPRDWTSDFHRGAGEVCNTQGPSGQSVSRNASGIEPEAPFESATHERHKVRDGLDVVGGIGLGALGAIASIGERLFEGLLAGGETPKPPPRQEPVPHPEFPEMRAARAAEIASTASRQESSEAQRLVDYWDERKRQRGRYRD